jgi:hypothetical protein
MATDRITPEDKMVLDMARYAKDIAAYHGKVKDLEHQVLVLKLAMKHGMQEGDTIEEDASISRKPTVKLASCEAVNLASCEAVVAAE